jgi:hypothetical protein
MCSTLAICGSMTVNIVFYGLPIEFGLQLIAAALASLVEEGCAQRDLQRARSRLGATLAAHQTGDGVLFASRAWIVTARRAAVRPRHPARQRSPAARRS